MTHDAILEIGGRYVAIPLSTAVLDSPKRLLTALSKAAVTAGADYPIISDPKARRLLSDLIKATQARPLVARTIGRSAAELSSAV
jgi:hypothetical protein